MHLGPTVGHSLWHRHRPKIGQQVLVHHDIPGRIRTLRPSLEPAARCRADSTEQRSRPFCTPSRVRVEKKSRPRSTSRWRFPPAASSKSKQRWLRTVRPALSQSRPRLISPTTSIVAGLSTSRALVGALARRALLLRSERRPLKRCCCPASAYPAIGLAVVACIALFYYRCVSSASLLAVCRLSPQRAARRARARSSRGQASRPKRKRAAAARVRRPKPRAE